MASDPKRLLAAATLMLAVSLPLPAGAEPTPQEKETARALMDQGDESFAQRDYAAALKAYTGAHAIMRVPTTAIEVAKTQEKLGRLVEARDALMEAVRYPRAPDEPAAFTAARTEAVERAAALAERIPTVLVRIAGLPDGAEPRVKIDGVAIPPAAAALPLKVNPGKHRVVASSDATTEASRDVEVAERASVTVDLTVTPLPPSVIEARRAREDSGPRPLRTVGIVTTGVGGAAVLVGALFGLNASSKQDDAGCPNNVCKDDASADTLRSANDSATAANIAFIGGGVLVAAGLTMWWLGSRSPASSSGSGRARITILPTGVGGAF